MNPVIFISTFCVLGQTGFKENPAKKQSLFVFPQGNYLLIRSINIVKQHATGEKVPAPQFPRIKYLSHTLYIPAASLQMFLLSSSAVRSLERLAQQTPACVHENVLFSFCYMHPSTKGPFKQIKLLRGACWQNGRCFKQRGLDGKQLEHWEGQRSGEEHICMIPLRMKWITLGTLVGVHLDPAVILVLATWWRLFLERGKGRKRNRSETVSLEKPVRGCVWS